MKASVPEGRSAVVGPITRAAMAVALVSLWSAISAVPGLAQVRGAQRAPGAQIGLALSGGGAKGFAHIGLLQVLEAEGIPVHVVAGTSMGAVVGGLYASGFTTPMLHVMATDVDWTGVFLGQSDRASLPIERRVIEERTAVSFPIRGGSVQLPSALVSGQGISERLDELTWGAKNQRDFTRFPIPFTAITTDLESGEAVALHNGTLSDALRASTAIPTVFEPVRLQGRLLVDGGLGRNIPAEDARRLGADVLICSDVTDDLADPSDLQTIAEVAMQSVAFHMVRINEEQREFCDVLIRPEMGDLNSASFNEGLLLIEVGREAARAALPAIRRALADVSAAPPVERPVSARTDSITVDRVDFVGFERTPASWVRRLLGIEEGDRVGPGEMRRAVRGVYATGLFTRVSYRLTAVNPGPDRYRVAIVAEETSRDRFGFGLRYESNQKAALLFALTFQNKLRYGSTARVEARLGEQITLTGSFFSTAHAGTDLSFGLTGNLTRAPLDLFEGERRVARIDSKTEELGSFAGFRLGHLALAGATLTAGRSHPDAEVAAADSIIPAGETYLTVGGLAQIDAMDEAVFPHSGVAITLVGETSVAGGSFSRALARVRVAAPVTETVTLLGRVLAGVAGGPDLPPHYRFYLGGDFEYSVYPYAQHALYGISPQELSGKDVKALGVAVQWEARRGWYSAVHWNAGSGGDGLSWPGGLEESGWALSLGTRSPIGPLKAAVAWGGGDFTPAFSIDLGRRF